MKYSNKKQRILSKLANSTFIGIGVLATFLSRSILNIKSINPFDDPSIFICELDTCRCYLDLQLANQKQLCGKFLLPEPSDRPNRINQYRGSNRAVLRLTEQFNLFNMQGMSRIKSGLSRQIERLLEFSIPPRCSAALDLNQADIQPSKLSYRALYNFSPWDVKDNYISRVDILFWDSPSPINIFYDSTGKFKLRNNLTFLIIVLIIIS